MSLARDLEHGWVYVKPLDVEVRTVDLAGKPDDATTKLYEGLPSKELPLLALRYPPTMRRPEAVWSAPLNAESTGLLVGMLVRSKPSNGLPPLPYDRYNSSFCP